MASSTKGWGETQTTTQSYLNQLALFSAGLFLVGSIISFYIAFKNHQMSAAPLESIMQTVP